MRWNEIAEDDQHSSNWRAKMLAAAMEPESMFTAIQPEESGLDRTIYASESPHHPVVVIDHRPGKHFGPDASGIVLAMGEMSGDPLIDHWLTENADALLAYSNGDFDSVDFFNAMRQIQRTDETFRLDEMANFRKGRFNAPVTFWIRPEPNPLPHQARVKCNSNYSDRASASDNFSIQLLPTPAVSPNHNTGSVSSKDVAGMIRWIGVHQQTFLDFYFGRISQSALETALTAKPYT